MDSYDSDGFSFWYNLPYGNGSRGMYYFTCLLGFLPTITSISNKKEIDNPLPLARPRPSCRHRHRRASLLPGPRPQRSPIR